MKKKNINRKQHKIHEIFSFISKKPKKKVSIKQDNKKKNEQKNIIKKKKEKKKKKKQITHKQSRVKLTLISYTIQQHKIEENIVQNKKKKIR